MCILILHPHFTTVESLSVTKNCSNKLKPLFNLVFNYDQHAMLILEKKLL